MQALLCQDLSLVVMVCEAVNPTQVFGGGGGSGGTCLLQQPILLSLIQQLSRDLTTNTLLKLR